MDRQHISTGTPWEALAGYSRAIRVGHHIFVSGTTAADENGVVQSPDDAAGQTRYILEKIAAALAEAGGSMNDIVRTRIFISNINDWEAVARVHGEMFAVVRPANTLILAVPVTAGMLVEIEAEAIVDE